MRTLTIAAALAVGLALTACSSSGGGDGQSSAASPPNTSSSASPSFDRVAAEGEIKQNWEAFFSKSTPLAKKLDYLQNGDTLKVAVEQFGKDPRTAQTSAEVTSVTVTSPTSADVKYQVLLNGTVALPDASGTAVREDGVWKVSDSTLCGLLELMGGTHIPGC